MFSRWCHMSLKDKYLNQPFPFKARSRGYRQVWANHGVSTTANFPQSLEVQPMQRIASYHGTCEDNCWWSYSVFIGFLLKSNISAPANLLSENDKYVKAQLAVTEISTSEFQFLQEEAQDECRWRAVNWAWKSSFRKSPPPAFPPNRVTMETTWARWKIMRHRALMPGITPDYH